MARVLSTCVVNRSTTEPARGTLAFFALACAITWTLAVPAARAWVEHAAPSPAAVACAGLSAFGPLLAALIVSARQRRLRSTFGHWRANPLYVALALFTPMALHLVATALDAASGGHPKEWLHPPQKPEDVAALIVFPLGEEFGWRGFAQGRMTDRFGLLKGSLLVGLMWGAWHLAYSFTPAKAGFDATLFAITMIELPLYSILIGWVFERSNRSMVVAIAFHAGAHLDHLERSPDLRLHAFHLAVVAAAAGVVAYVVSRGQRAGKSPSSASARNTGAALAAIPARAAASRESP